MPRHTAALALLSLAPLALAQDDAPIEPAGWTASARLDVRHELDFDTDLDNGASITTNQTQGAARITFTRPDQKLAFTLGVGAGITDYDIDDGATLLAGFDDDPFDTFYRQRLEFSGRYAFDDQWGIYGLVGLEAAYEGGADLGSALLGGGTFLGTWTSADRSLTLGFGVGAFTRLDESPVVFPFVTVRWQIDERLRLENERLGLALTYEPDNEWDFSLFGRYDRADYRLDENATLASEGVLKDSRIALGGRVAWSPEGVDGLTLALTAGANLYREVEILDDDGDQRFSEEADPSAFLAFRVTYAF